MLLAAIADADHKWNLWRIHARSEQLHTVRFRTRLSLRLGDDPRVAPHLLTIAGITVDLRDIDFLLHRVDTTSTHPFTERDRIEPRKRRLNHVTSRVAAIARPAAVETGLVARWCIASK